MFTSSTAESTAANRNAADRVRRHTGKHTLSRIDEMTRENIRAHAHMPRHVLDARIAELERAWDMERVLEMNASLLALSGALLGATRDRRWFFLTGAVLGFLTQHAIMGWCPPVPVFRKFGIRTQSEIDQEKFALKALRGDFADLSVGRASVTEVMQAVER
jgi:hypothetical protein